MERPIETGKVRDAVGRTPRAERRRSRILEAAGHCFTRQGFAKTTVEEIAAAAGVSKGLVYTYFEGKDALLEAVLDQAFDEWGQVIDAAEPGEHATALERLARRHRAMVQFARSNPVLASILSRDERVVLLGRERAIEQSLEQWRVRLIELLRAGVADGEVADDLDVERTADLIRLIYGSITERLFDGTANVGDDAFLDAVERVLLGGVRSPAAQGAVS